MGLELTAHFTPGPFTLLKGRYVGLFTSQADQEAASSLLDLQVTPFGGFNGNADNPWNAVPLNGSSPDDRTFAQELRMPDGLNGGIVSLARVNGRFAPSFGTVTSGGWLLP
jgi:hypothetical protein